MTIKICDKCNVQNPQNEMIIYDTYKTVLRLDLCNKCYDEMVTIIKNNISVGTISHNCNIDYKDEE